MWSFLLPGQVVEFLLLGAVALVWPMQPCSTLIVCLSSSISVINNYSGSHVYTAPQGDTNNKVQFLEELREDRAVCQGPWIIGDFNLIYTRMKIITTGI